MYHADFIVDPAVLYQIVVILVQLFACLEADPVGQKVIMKIVRVAVDGYQRLIVRKLPGGKFQTDLVNLLRRQVSILREGLHKMKKLPLIRFTVLLLGGHHFKVSGVGTAVKTGYQALSFADSFLFADDVEHGTQ